MVGMGVAGGEGEGATLGTANLYPAILWRTVDVCVCQITPNNYKTKVCNVTLLSFPAVFMAYLSIAFNYIVAS